MTGFTKSEKLSYVGFSQGSAQFFATLSTQPHTAARVNAFVALSPPATVKGESRALVLASPWFPVGTWRACAVCHGRVHCHDIVRMGLPCDGARACVCGVAGLAPSLIRTLIQASHDFIYLFLGRR